MDVRYNDLQDQLSPFHGTRVSTAAEIARIIDASRSREPFFSELVGENGYKLTIGLGADVGCVQYGPSGGEPPYLMAIPDAPTAGAEVEFLAGGQRASVPEHYYLPFDLARQIAVCFVETGRPSAAVRWEELGPRAS
jgi:hypothetical protein